jgi:bisphosphoglycerate-dependent phosphoglycerate mutase
LQTIFPYVKNKNLNINIDYALSEIHHINIIAKKSHGIQLPNYLKKKYNYNPKYKSSINSKQIIFPEEYKDIIIRFKKFLKFLFINYIHSDYNIILVTHQSLCKVILEIINKYKNINKDLINNYSLGKLCLVFDYNNWTFTEIN